jgi:hypothetical protein
MEYSDAAYAPALQWSVDAYAVQHPGEPSPPAVQSVAVHLIALCASLERHVSAGEAIRLRQHYADIGGLHWLSPPAEPAKLTVLSPLGARTPAEHLTRAREWAEQCWQSWEPHHPQVRAWLERVHP